MQANDDDKNGVDDPSLAADTLATPSGSYWAELTRFPLVSL